MFNIGDKFELKISGVFVIEGGIFYAAEGIKDYLFDEDELKQLISNSEGISVEDELKQLISKSEGISIGHIGKFTEALKELEEMAKNS